MVPLHPVASPVELATLRLPLPLAIALSAALDAGVPMKVGRSTRGTWVLAVYQLRGRFVPALREAGARQFGPRGRRAGWMLDERPADFRFGEGLGDDGTGRMRVNKLIGNAYGMAVTDSSVRAAWNILQKVRPLLSDSGATYRTFRLSPEPWLEALWDGLAGAENSRVADYLDAMDAGG